MRPSYVLLAATSTFFVNTYHVSLTVAARKKSGLKYPVAYASKELADKDPNAYLFNCGESPYEVYDLGTVLTCESSPASTRQLHRESDTIPRCAARHRPALPHPGCHSGRRLDSLAYYLCRWVYEQFWPQGPDSVSHPFVDT